MIYHKKYKKKKKKLLSRYLNFFLIKFEHLVALKLIILKKNNIICDLLINTTKCLSLIRESTVLHLAQEFVSKFTQNFFIFLKKCYRVKKLDGACCLEIII